MNKREMIEALSAKGLKKKDANKFIDGFISCITDALVAGEKVIIQDFGTFFVKEHAAHLGRNPHTGEAVNVPAFNAPTFKAGKGLRDKVNEER